MFITFDKLLWNRKERPFDLPGFNRTLYVLSYDSIWSLSKSAQPVQLAHVAALFFPWLCAYGYWVYFYYLKQRQESNLCHWVYETQLEPSPVHSACIFKTKNPELLKAQGFCGLSITLYFRLRIDKICPGHFKFKTWWLFKWEGRFWNK